MGKFSRTFSLLRASWDILRADKEMMIFPVLSLVITVIFYLGILLITVASVSSVSQLQSFQNSHHLVYYIVLFLVYFCNYVIAIFFNSAVVACAFVRMNGKNPTVSFGFRAAWSRIHLIIGWALFASSVGLLLNMLEQWLGKFGRAFIGWFLEIGWALASFLVIPVFVVEKKGPVQALKDSVVLLKKTWGEDLISGVSFSLVSLFLTIPAIVIMMMIVVLGGPVLKLFVFFTVIFYLIAVAMLISLLKTIFQVALYQYAKTEQVPAGFDETDLLGAVGSKWR